MSDPMVYAVMLTADRPEMARRAVECFRRQTYKKRFLLVYDTGGEPFFYGSQQADVTIRELHNSYATIGEIRNRAIGHADDVPFDPDIIVHWDDDDWSHPSRIEEQVAFLRGNPDAECVAYDSMLFWREPSRLTAGGYPVYPAEAWIYSGYPLGTSLCYWRRAWERQPFPDTSYGEDTEWLKRAKWKAKPSLVTLLGGSYGVVESPRMIASIHGGNTSNYDLPMLARENPRSWRRAPEWDEHCKKVMTL